MKLKQITALILAFAIAAPVIAGQNHPMSGHSMPMHRAPAPKSKMRDMGHGVFMDSKGKYHSKNGKFMSTPEANKRLGKGGHKPGPMRDSKGRFVGKHTPPVHKPTMMSKLKSKFGHHPKPHPKS
jgi:hypothetical protein